MNDLQVLTKQFEGANVKIIRDENGQLLFELYSTGMALGQSKTSKGKLYPNKDRIDNNVKNAEISTVVHNAQQFLTETSLYDLMLEMKTDKVKPFRKWVTGEVLPSIRQTGTYSNTNQTTDNSVTLLLAEQLKNVSNIMSTFIVSNETAMNGLKQEIQYQTESVRQETNNIRRETETIKNIVKDKMHEINQVKEMIGFRARNTMSLSYFLKDKLFQIYGFKVKGTDREYISAKMKVFKEFNVDRWEQIAVGNYSRVHAFIDCLEK